MASEILQRKMIEILGNLPNCMAIADNVILCATSFNTMYDTLDKVLNQFLECGNVVKQTEVGTVSK